MRKYQQYLHGDRPRFDELLEEHSRVDTCRAILDAEVLQTGDLVVGPDNLHKFLSQTIKESVHEVESEDRPVLVMIFPHCDKDFGFQMGGKHGGLENPSFGMDDFIRAVGSQGSSQIRICLVTSASSSTGWAINPCHDLQFSEVESQSSALELMDAWPTSATINRRLVGHEHASDISQTLASMWIEDFDPENCHTEPFE